MSALILGVVVDVYIHILIEHFQCFGVGWISSSASFFAVLNSSEFVILDPEIGLQDFRRRREPEKGGIAGCDWVVVIALVLLAKHSCGRAEECGSGSKCNRTHSYAAKKGSPRKCPRG